MDERDPSPAAREPAPPPRDRAAVARAETCDAPAPIHDAPTGGPGWSVAAEPDLREGARLGGRFELVSLLGRGGMGAVWRARDLAVGRDVALKVVLARGDRMDDRRARFKREGEVTASLHHPGIVRVHAGGEVDGMPFLAYELIEGGRTLEDVFASGAPLERKVALVRDAARALGYAHRRGVVHRDVKPSNILVDAEGRARVADFGLAAAANLERLTQTGALVGTPTHMSPEQIGANGEQVGPATDVWALGVVLYQALTGALPFEGETLVALGVAIAAGRFPAPRELAPGVPAGLEAICVTALAPSPRDRYPHADALADDLDRFLAGRQVVPATQRRRGRRRRVALVALLAAAALGLAAARAVERSRRAAALEALARDADRLTLRVTSGVEPLRRDADERGALLARMEALDPAAEEPRLVGPRLRLRALDALARGDAARLGHLAAEPGAPGVDGLLALAAGAARLDPDALGQAIDAGWTRPEVLLLRARAVGRGGVVADEAVARRTLRDLEAAAAAGLALDDLAHQARALAAARLRRVGEARAALERVAAPPGVVAWAVALAEVEDALDRVDAMALVDRLPPGAPPAALRDDAARVAGRARERARPAVEALARSSDALAAAEVEAVVDRVALAARLEPGRAVPREVLDALVAAVVSFRRRVPPRVALAVAELARDDLRVQGRIAHFARAENAASKLALLPVVRRAYEMARAPDERRELGIVLCIVFDGLPVDDRRPAELDALATELLADPGLSEPVARGTLHELREKARRQLGRYEGALEDIDAALRCVPEREVLLVDRAQVLAQLGEPDAALEDAIEYVRRTSWAREAKVPVGALDDATRLVWELGRGRGRDGDVRAVLDRYMIARSERWGWSLRAALLAAEAGDAEAAAVHVERALHGLRLSDDDADRASFLGAASAALTALRAGALARATETLARMVEELERARAGGMLP